jgi:methylmalonyl-CoA mutase cobalamin-binding domain/chain
MSLARSIVPDPSDLATAPRASIPPGVRVVLAKVGLDGHDRGIKVIARGLRDAGFHVVYGGLWQTPEAVAQTVMDEDASWLGISLLSGAHLTLIPRVIEALRKNGLTDVGVVVGGIFPAADLPKLHELGVAAVFGPGASIKDVAACLARPPLRPASPQQLIDRYRQRDRLALARLVSMIVRGNQLEVIAAAVGGHEAPTKLRNDAAPIPRGTIALTGNAGVGKSSLIARLIQELRKRRLAVAVLACDPQSALTGGALLGDRIRMAGCMPDPDVFIRSLAAPSGAQGIVPNLDLLAGILRGFGFEVVLIETVGTGQNDVAVRGVADAVVVLLQPEAGDSVQWEKAGLLDIADVIVIHKSDLPGADRTESELRQHLALPGVRKVPLVRVSAAQNDGIAELWDILQRA